MVDLDDVELRAKVTRFLLTYFGPLGLHHFGTQTNAMLFEKYAELASEVIKIVDEGRTK